MEKPPVRNPFGDLVLRTTRDVKSRSALASGLCCLILAGCSGSPREAHYATKGAVLMPAAGDRSGLRLTSWTDQSGAEYQADALASVEPGE
jgi:hypothetical protein